MKNLKKINRILNLLIFILIIVFYSQSIISSENRIIFNSLPNLVSKLKISLKDNNLYDLGLWDNEEIKKVDIYHDNKGFIRIGNKINEIFKSL